MSKRLQEDVLFVCVDGMADCYPSIVETPHRVSGKERYEIVKKVKKDLLEKGCRVKLLNPRRDSDIKIPTFPVFTAPINKKEYNKELDYSIFILNKLYNLIKDEDFTHVIIFQYDGHINDFDYWDDKFLEYDFIGSINGKTSELNREDFFSLKQNKRGIHFNGGFSLRSRRLIERCSSISLSTISEMYKKFGCNNEDLILLDYLNWKRVPLDPKIINKFVNVTGATKSFGFHKN